MKRPRYRVFDYTPRHYKPEQDEQERRKRRLGFSSYRRHRTKKRSPLMWLLFLLAALFIYLKFAGMI